MGQNSQTTKRIKVTRLTKRCKKFQEKTQES